VQILWKMLQAGRFELFEQVFEKTFESTCCVCLLLMPLLCVPVLCSFVLGVCSVRLDRVAFFLF